jgi:hypothetical protein
MDNFIACESFELSQPYHYRVGMSHEEVRTVFGQTQPMPSISRPQRGWRSMSKDDYGVGWPVYKFESSHANVIVASCGVYHAGGGWHILFFDSMGTLVGFERTPDGLIYYGRLFSHNIAA